MSDVAKSTAVWSDMAGDFVSPPTPSVSGPALVPDHPAQPPAAAAPAVTPGAPATVDQRAMAAMRDQILKMGGICCPYCNHAFIPEGKPVQAVAPVAPPASEPAPVAPPAQDPPLPEHVEEAQALADELGGPVDSEDGVHGTQMPGTATDKAEAGKAPKLSLRQKKKILGMWRDSVDDEHRVELLVRFGIKRQHIAAWTQMDQKGLLDKPETEDDESL